MADDLNELRSRIRIVDLVGQVVKLKKSGRNWSGLCPFHDDRNPSFVVSDETGRYRCWSCGEKGDIFNWVMKTQHVDFPEALKILAQSVGYTLSGKRSEDPSVRERYRAAMTAALEFFRTQLAKSETASKYVENRGLEADQVELWELGYAPESDAALATYLSKQGIKLAEAKELFLVEQDGGGGFFDKFRGRLMFPIRDERGQLVAFGGRIIGDGMPKYINSSDTPLFRKSRTLYGLNVAKTNLKAGVPLVLCEGYLDVIACHRASVHTAVASLGTSMTDEHAKLIARWTDQVVILYDADKAGEKAAVRAHEMLKAENIKVRVALMPPGEDPDTLLKIGGPQAVQAAVDGGRTPASFQIELLVRRLDPEDNSFWKEAAEILSTTATEMEVAELAQKLAPLHPNLKDPKEAYAALRRMVVLERRNRSGRPAPRQNSPTSQPSKLGIKAAEAVLFRAFLSDPHRIAAWQAFAEEDLFLTHTASELAAAIRTTFTEAAPAGPPANWLSEIEPPEQQELLTEIAMRDSTTLLTPEFVRDTVNSLRLKREERHLQRIKTTESGDERLRQLQEKLTEQNEAKTRRNKGL